MGSFLRYFKNEASRRKRMGYLKIIIKKESIMSLNVKNNVYWVGKIDWELRIND